MSSFALYAVLSKNINVVYYKYTDGAVTDNGYDYLDNDIMALWS